MLRRCLTAGALASFVLASAGVALAQEADSFVLDFTDSSSQPFEGEQCGATATRTRPFAREAEGLVVTQPRVGDRDPSGGTRVTKIDVAGSVVTVTVVADGPSLCDPAQGGAPPGSSKHWRVDYLVAVAYRQRVEANIRVFFDSSLRGAKWDMFATTIRNGRAGAFRERYTAIRWQRFGGLTAVGTGKVRLERCRRNCGADGKRVRVTASDPGFCAASDRIEYRRLKVTLGGRTRFARRLVC